MRLQRGFWLSALAGGILILTAAAPVTPIDVEANRRRLQELRVSDPEQYARLARQYERFRSLPDEQQEKIRQFDRQLHDEDSQTRARLLQALGEYAAWVTRLPEPDRQRILSAATADERLRLIREVKERQWLEQLPRVQHDEWRATPENGRAALAERWRNEEQKQNEQWIEARKNWDTYVEPPVPVAAQEEAARQIRLFLENRLYPMLNANERERLWKAEADRLTNPFAMIRTVIELSERHPVLALEPRYLTFASLPPEYQRAMQTLPASVQTSLKQLDGQWPRFPIAATEALRKYGVAPKPQLGPASAKDFSPPIEEFVERKLKPKLSASERERLTRAEGRWPEYPLALHELAREHKMQISELSLPIDPQRLERLKPRRPLTSALPEPPERLLREFALKLNAEDSDGPRLSLSNPVDREIIKKKFFEKYPDMLERLRQQDKAKMDMKKKRP